MPINLDSISPPTAAFVKYFGSKTKLNGHCLIKVFIPWSLLIVGWFMDYFLGVPGLKQSYLVKMSELSIFAPNLETGVATIPGTGNEPVTWTSGRDTAKAMLHLLQVPKGEWDEHIYISGETSTWNKAVDKIGQRHGTRTYKIVAD
jgi:hypothetical protein